MLAMIFSAPPQRSHVSISMPKTRFRRLAQLIATCGVTVPGAAVAARDAPYNTGQIIAVDGGRSI
jgi:hypothetical protein